MSKSRVDIYCCYWGQFYAISRFISPVSEPFDFHDELLGLSSWRRGERGRRPWAGRPWWRMSIGVRRWTRSSAVVIWNNSTGYEAASIKKCQAWVQVNSRLTKNTSISKRPGRRGRKGYEGWARLFRLSFWLVKISNGALLLNKALQCIKHRLASEKPAWSG